MNLAMMRDIDRADPIGGLGPRVTPAPTPAPAPVRRPDGIVVDSDGKMSTDLPLPPGMAPAPWPFPTGTAAPAPEPEPGAAHGFMRIRVLGAFPWRLAEGTVLAVEPYAYEDGWAPIEGQRGHLLFWFPSEEEGNWWERMPEPEPGTHGFMRGQVIRARVEDDQVVCKTAREPLKAGDVIEHVYGGPLTVFDITRFGTILCRDLDGNSHSTSYAFEGELWSRA